MSRHCIALDVGTQSCRAAVVTSEGGIRGIAQEKHEVDSPRNGWAQQDPGMWWEEICRAARRVLADTGVEAGSIEAVAACGQMHGPVGIDEAGGVTTGRVQLWCDKRCYRQAEELLGRSDGDHLAAVAGSSPNPAWTGVKVRWHLDNEPDVYEETRWFLVPKDFINYRLTGVAAGDPSEASGSFLWDCRRNCYSGELASAVGVPVGISNEPEAGLKGAALLAAAGAGIIDDAAETALERRRVEETIEPDRSVLDVYASSQKEFIRIYEHMLGFWMKRGGE